MNDILFHIIGILAPARCPECDVITQRVGLFCDACLEKIKHVEEPCSGCGKPKKYCECAGMKFSLNMTSPYIYAGPIASAIKRFKFFGQTSISKILAEPMVNSVKASFPDVSFDLVTCVPQTKRKRRQRGYNQSALLARDCARIMLIPWSNSLVKVRDTQDQHDLKAKERVKNLKAAFAVNVKCDVKGKTVLLCDDIKTTGTTLYECRKTLMKAGAKAVYCVTAAVVVPEEK